MRVIVLILVRVLVSHKSEGHTFVTQEFEVLERVVESFRMRVIVLKHSIIGAFRVYGYWLLGTIGWPVPLGRGGSEKTIMDSMPTEKISRAGGPLRDMV